MRSSLFWSATTNNCITTTTHTTTITTMRSSLFWSAGTVVFCVCHDAAYGLLAAVVHCHCCAIGGGWSNAKPVPKTKNKGTKSPVTKPPSRCDPETYWVRKQSQWMQYSTITINQQQQQILILFVYDILFCFPLFLALVVSVCLVLVNIYLLFLGFG
jgi:hypothetical protein